MSSKFQIFTTFLSLRRAYLGLLFSITVTPPVRTFTIMHYSGLCVTVRESDSRLRLSETCTEKFSLTSNKNLVHMATGKCAIPESLADDSRIKLTADCSNIGTRFEQTSGLSMKHLQTGKCVHPFGGSTYPTSDSDIVIYNGCGSNRLQFKFIWGNIPIFKFCYSFEFL